jgi:peptidoglycan/xylan/chitin deacetylase (PgdA/CDA1 family)
MMFLFVFAHRVRGFITMRLQPGRLLLTGLVVLASSVPEMAHAAGPWNGHAVAFTFSSDDGDRPANLAWSDAFTSRGQSYTLFIPSTWVAMTSTKLTAADLRTLHAQGIEIGSHSRTHPRLTDVDDAQLLDELVGSCRDLEATLQTPDYRCRTIAYPVHAHDLHVMAVAESLGFTAARDGGTSSTGGYPDFSLGKATWSETSLFEVPLTVVASYLAGPQTSFTEAQTRAKVDTLLIATAPRNMWINVYAHSLADIDTQHMEWILDELKKGDTWIANFAAVADFYRAGHGMPIPTEVGTPVPVLLSHFVAVPRPDGILLKWLASGDMDYAGIRVQRSVRAEGEYARVSATLLPPAASGEYLDLDTKPGITYYYRLEVLSRAGTTQFFGPIAASRQTGELVEPGPVLGQAFPNPSWNGRRTTIPFSLPRSSPVMLRVLDLSGHNVKTLVTEGMDAGAHSVSWDGRDDRGEGVPSGLYLYQLEALGVEATHKLFWIE